MNAPRLAPVALALGLLVAPAAAQDDAAGRLASMNRFYAELDAVSATLVQELRLPAFPMANSDIEHALSLHRESDSVALRHRKGQPGGSVVLAGGEQLLVSLDMMTKRYLRAEIEGGFETLFDDPRVAQLPVPGLFLLRALVEGPLIATDGEAVVSEVGRELVGETAARHLRLDGEFAGDLWIAEGREPWLLKFVPQPPGEDDLPEGVEGGMLAEVSFVFSRWNAEPDLEGAFDVTPPKGFTESESVMPDMGSMVPVAGPADAPDAPAPRGGHGPGADHPTVGTPAPDVTLTSLDGSERALSDLRGDVVVLDFWATWCKPCLMGLPTVKQVTGEYAERGVSFYAVDVREKPDRIQALLDKRGWELPVVLDADGSISRAFGVGPIPHTVILDADGNVARVHIGFSDDLERTLRADLDALLGEG